ncbi:hypothetical protein F3Y22_tig00002237pilonHSYRG00170 [Hibiscus syriacus]|uniref:Uncharacterized protein n=1 Tax=Hibiscus syriacus TaxID=106335 RepID=A0A6A3CXQ1_HIBSY|nr:hypothetical protein F3Y22_tig00002237pilonHSYRG00170 [Hibiscus syriacus]
MFLLSGGHGGKGENGWKGMPGANLQVSKLSSYGDPNCYRKRSGDTLGSFVYVPCEVIKQRMQVQGSGNSRNSAIMNDQLRMKSGEQMYGYYTGMFQVGCSIWKEQGLKGLYAESRSSILGEPLLQKVKESCTRRTMLIHERPTVSWKKQVEELTWQLQKLQREKENWGANKTSGKVPVTQGVTVVDNETMNKLTTENEQLKAQVATLEQICEVRLKQATEAEMRIIDLKTAMQRFYPDFVLY